MTLKSQGIEPPSLPRPPVFVAALGKEARTVAIDLTLELRSAGLGTWMAFGQRGLKSQMREADKRDAQYVVILGENEIKTGQATVRDMAQGQQESVALGDLGKWLSARISQS
jgi:histidyl-tRNA synthetase